MKRVDLPTSYWMLAGENISRFVVATVASSVDLVVHLGLDRHGAGRVGEIVAVPRRVENDIIESEALLVFDTNRLARMSGVPSRQEAFERAGIDVYRLLGAICWAQFSGSASVPEWC